VEYAAIPKGGSVAVFGLGPIGQMSCRVARHRGAGRVIGIDLVPDRLGLARRHGVEVIDSSNGEDVVAAIRDRTGGRGADSVIDAVGMEAHGAPVAKLAQGLAARLPDAIAVPMIEKAGIDRLAVVRRAIRAVRRGGTISLS